MLELVGAGIRCNGGLGEVGRGDEVGIMWVNRAVKVEVIMEEVVEWWRWCVVAT